MTKLDKSTEEVISSVAMVKGCQTCRFKREITIYQKHCDELDVEISGYSGQNCTMYQPVKEKKK